MSLWKFMLYSLIALFSKKMRSVLLLYWILVIPLKTFKIRLTASAKLVSFQAKETREGSSPI